MIGKTLGHYQVTSQLGKGGMGEVYQAKDQKLGREVAIKVLPEEFAKDADRVTRFQREAKLLASLNHPNIAAIYGLEESAGTQFLVLELVEGETLADQIKKDPIPVEECLKLALQIAEALEAAHEKGVIHRDLKPANIKVTPEGKVKVLDFGLAKAFAGDQADLNLSNSPTLSNAATQQGVILGTAAYMSPEQAKGKAVDKRTDVWAFGCVVFEMLTGRSLFSADDVSQTLARVLERQPDFSSLPANPHPKIIEMLERCLEKDARNRYGSISDARVDIQKALADPDGVLVQPAASAEPRWKRRILLPWVAATLVLSALATALIVWRLKPPEARQVTRLYHELPDGLQFRTTAPVLTVSPDGRQIVYSAGGKLYRLSMDQLEAREIPGASDNPNRPFFSPDGKWVGYISGADNRIVKIPVDGGMPVALSDPAQAFSLVDWGTDNTIVHGEMGKGIMRISGDGGKPELIVKADNEMLAMPQILPGGRAILFTRIVAGGTSQSTIFVQSLQSGARRELFEGMAARYLPTGHIVYGSASGLFAVPFDLDTLEVTGGHIPVIGGIASPVQVSVSNTGTLAYVPETSRNIPNGKRALVWVDRKGNVEPLGADPGAYFSPRISPKGTSVAVRIAQSSTSGDIWTWDLSRKFMKRVTSNSGSGVPVWTPDGKRIVYAYGLTICWKAADGTGKDETLSTATDRISLPATWSEGGKTLLFMDSSLTLQSGWDIGSLSMDGSYSRKALLHEKYREYQPRISPDGRWMAYTSNESGRNEVYVRPYPGLEGAWEQASVNGGNSPLWSQDSRELYYRSGDAVMAVPVKTSPALSLGKPEILFRGKYTSMLLILVEADYSPWDISPDGKRFLMMKDEQSAAPTAEGPQRIHIVLNWFEELKQHIPVK
jgi:serine/threonine protein kinase